MRLNWYDMVVGVALLWGLWSGVRNGFFGEIFRIAGWIAMFWMAITFYVPAGDYLQRAFQLPEEPSRLAAFILIAIPVFIITGRMRNAVHLRMKRFAFGAFVENSGGAIIGVARMIVVMAVITILASLMRSPFWHKHVSKESKFGSFVVSEFPSVSEVVNRQFSEKLWFADEFKRRKDPTIEENP